jgi:hypothetical protein
MFDGLERNDDIGPAVGYRNVLAIEIGAMKFCIRRQAGMADDIDADVVEDEIACMLEKPPDAAADVDNPATRVPRAQKFDGGAIDRRVAFTVALQSALDGGWI